MGTNKKILVTGGVGYIGSHTCVELVKAGYDGYINWEFCHPAKENGAFAGIDYVHNQTEMALEYLRGLRDNAVA